MPVTLFANTYYPALSLHSTMSIGAKRQELGEPTGRNALLLKLKEVSPFSGSIEMLVFPGDTLVMG